MASRDRLTRTVILSPTVVDELHDIWRWNATQYSPTHADAYLGFVKKRIFGLGRHCLRGQTISLRPDLRYLLIRRKSQGHGHVAVYQFDDMQVHVLHIFHTAQDWPSKLAESPHGPV